MRIGKPAFDVKDKTDLINKVEDESYKILTTFIFEWNASILCKTEINRFAIV